MTRPPKFPRWASADTYGSGPKSASDTKVEPTDGEKSRGWYPDRKPPARKANWLWNLVTRWINYLGDIPVLNWHAPILNDIAAAALNTSVTRYQTGLQGIFYDPMRGYWWATGSNTAKRVYVGDFHYMVAIDTAVVPTLKFTMGVVADNHKVVLVSNALISNPGDFVETVAQSDDSTGLFGAMTWASRTIDGPIGTGARCGDIVKTPSGRLVIVGYIDGDHTAWVSDDHGTTWTPKTVGTQTDSLSGLDRVVCGKDGLLVAFTSATEGNGGSSFWISDDDGDTWTERADIGIHSIIDACYSDSDDRWYFATSGHLYVTDSPTEGVLTLTTDPQTDDINSGTINAIACFGSALIASVNLDPKWSYLLMSWDQGTTWQLVHRIYGSDFYGIGVSPQGQFAAVGNDGSGNGIVQVALKAAELSR